MPRFSSAGEWIPVGAISIAILVIVPAAIFWLSLNPAIIFLLSVAAISGGLFGELRDTWDSERRFSAARMLFRTFEWLSLAVAGYVILSIIGDNTTATA